MMYESPYPKDEGIKEKLDRLIEAQEKNKKKSFKPPVFKTALNKQKMAKGYIIVVEIGENKAISFRREPIVDGTIKLNDTVHAIKEKDIFLYKKKPFIFQPKTKLNPYNPLDGEHQTYGQKYIMARMESDRIKMARATIKGMAIFGIIIAVIAVIYFFTNNGGL